MRSNKKGIRSDRRYYRRSDRRSNRRSNRRYYRRSNRRYRRSDRRYYRSAEVLRKLKALEEQKQELMETIAATEAEVLRLQATRKTWEPKKEEAKEEAKQHRGFFKFGPERYDQVIEEEVQKSQDQIKKLAPILQDLIQQHSRLEKEMNELARQLEQNL